MSASSIYSKLDPCRREIRVLSILPGRLSDAIICELKVYSLDDKPVYEALSYVWGDQSDQHQIHIGGCAIYVRRNLYTALQYLRKSNVTRVIWIDALCINQEDLIERNYQVGLMSMIYLSAIEVFCWLGTGDDQEMFLSHPNPIDIHEALSLAWSGSLSDPELLNHCLRFQGDKLKSKILHFFHRGSNMTTTNNALAAFALLQLLAERSSGRESLNELPFFRPSSLPYEIEVADQFIDAFEVFRKLAEAPWWDRVWTIQEAIIPHKITMVYYRINIPWNMLQDAAWHIFESATMYDSLPPHQREVFHELQSRVFQVDKWRMPGRYARIKHVFPNEDLLQLAMDFRFRKATDPRDKIYALLGLVKKWAIHDPITPDYFATTAEAYIRATISLINEKQSLIVLEGRPGLTNIHQLPSWVQNWSESDFINFVFKRLHEKDYLYYAGGKGPPNPRLCCDTILTLDGINIDTVKTVGCVCERLDIAICKWENDIDNSGLPFDGLYKNGQPLIDALRSTLGADLLLKPPPPTRMFGMFGGPPPPFERAYSGRPNARDGVDWSDLETKSDHINEVIQAVTHGHRFFITESGYMGIAPRTILVGDNVFVLQGGPLPFILRHHAVEKPGKENCSHPLDHCFQLIGSCYVHGIMDGEAIESEENKFQQVYLI